MTEQVDKAQNGVSPWSDVRDSKHVKTISVRLNRDILKNMY